MTTSGVGWRHPVWRSGLLGKQDGVRRILEMNSSRRLLDRHSASLSLAPVLRSVGQLFRRTVPSEPVSPSSSPLQVRRRTGWSALFFAAGTEPLMAVLRHRVAEVDDADARVLLARRVLPPTEVERIWSVSPHAGRVEAHGALYKQRKAFSKRRALNE